jgi:BlaI family penicillinase repressor
VTPNLPALELECMKVLWRMQSATVAQVRSALPRPLAYTTIMTVLQRMSAKGVVERRKNGRAFVYSAVLDLDAARHAALAGVLANLFENDREALLRYISGMRRGAGPHLPVPRGRTKAPAREVVAPYIDETLL